MSETEKRDAKVLLRWDKARIRFQTLNEVTLCCLKSAPHAICGSGRVQKQSVLGSNLKRLLKSVNRFLDVTAFDLRYPRTIQFLHFVPVPGGSRHPLRANIWRS